MTNTTKLIRGYELSEAQCNAYMKTARRSAKYKKIRRRNEIISNVVSGILQVGIVGAVTLTTLLFFISCVGPM